MILVIVNHKMFSIFIMTISIEGKIWPLASCKQTKFTSIKYRPWWQISWFSFSDHAFLSHHCRKPFLHLKCQYLTLISLNFKSQGFLSHKGGFLWLLVFFSRNLESHRWISLTTIVFFFQGFLNYLGRFLRLINIFFQPPTELIHH